MRKLWRSLAAFASLRLLHLNNSPAGISILDATQGKAADSQDQRVCATCCSPLDGVALRHDHRAGEIVVSSSSNPGVVFTLGDCRVLRVRVDVDEADVAQLRLGARAHVTARSFGETKLWGHVVQIGEQLGKKNVQTDEPTEHVDKKILETLIELDRGHELPVGLRVDGYIETPR